MELSGKKYIVYCNLLCVVRYDAEAKQKAEEDNRGLG